MQAFCSLSPNCCVYFSFTKPPTRGLNMEKVFFLNVQSLRSHHDQLKLLIESFQTKPALVALCETWLSDNDPIDIYE